MIFTTIMLAACTGVVFGLGFIMGWTEREWNITHKRHRKGKSE